MIESNVKRILEMLSPSDIVLDIGGWACPFNRANYVLDAFPHATRGFYAKNGGPAYQGGEREHFSEATWIQRDICDRSPYPFSDKFFDFVICSHTLEDVRDPLYVCSEMVRIGKRGYIEVPSRVAESCRGAEQPRLAGLSHHRWLVDIEGTNLRFVMKYHLINGHWRFSLPISVFQSLKEEEKVQYLFWRDSFSFSETIIHGIDEIAGELERFVAGVRPYPAWRLELDRKTAPLRRRAGRVANKIMRKLR